MKNALAFKKYEKLTPNFVRPEILLHPNIPKPLHGLNPRTLLGEEWWNEVRQRAYKENNFCCWACGISKYDAKYHKWLEAHECYEFDYKNGIAEMIFISALCHSCHNFIHSGRMQMILGTDEMSPEKYNDIMAHGELILSKIDWKTVKNIFIKNLESIADWSSWKLILDGKEYHSKFKDFKEWLEYYEHSAETSR